MSFSLPRKGQPLRSPGRRVLGRLTYRPVPASERHDFVRAFSSWPNGEDLVGFAAILAGPGASEIGVQGIEYAHLPPVVLLHTLAGFESGDVVAVEPSGTVHLLYQRSSRHNVIFATERCNSFCLMCSQPPRQIDDSVRLLEHLRLVDLIDPETEELGITGGEPTLLQAGLLELVQRCKTVLPRTALHVLSNGRLFYYGAYARELGAIEHPDLMIGVPLYSDVDSEHDHIVQARGAFDQTLIGLHNLQRWRVATEIRVVIHGLNVGQLGRLAEFIYRNLTFAAHVTFMGLEPIGFAVANKELLWVDPFDYREELAAAVCWLAARGMSVSIYNHQLCVLPSSVWRYSRRSISTWKNQYLPDCESCSVKSDCGGFFASATQRFHSNHIHPLPSQACESPTEQSLHGSTKGRPS